VLDFSQPVTSDFILYSIGAIFLIVALGIVGVKKAKKS